MAIKYLSYDEYLDALVAVGQRTGNADKDYERWKKFHDGVVAILETCGSVSSEFNPTPDFYHSGDWFSSYEDGYDIKNTKIFKRSVLAKLQACVASTDPGARLWFCGIDGEAVNLEVCVTSDGTYVEWIGDVMYVDLTRVSDEEFQEGLNKLKVEE